jgi:hypothetical protein
MINVRTIKDLAAPRFAPFNVLDAPVAAWYDRQEDRYLAVCPACRRLVVYETEDTLYLELVWSEYRCCQGCRARMSFADNPGLVGAVLDVWRATGAYPQSASWAEAVPWYEYMARSQEIEAALEAATAPSIGGEASAERHASSPQA